MEIGRVLDLEGREAMNLLAHQAANNQDDTGQKPLLRKPPTTNTVGPPPPKRLLPIACDTPNGGSVPRVRSASTGRDKRSELQARYWALLFGNLQRAISEIYATVECYENLSSCQETILVLENYIRDFRALADWFKVSWDYETRPQQHRGAALAWDVRKSNPTSPRLRARSLSSPNPPVLHPSGRSSPYSGKNSPCPTIEECDQHRPQPPQQQLPVVVIDAVAPHNDVPECDAFMPNGTASVDGLQPASYAGGSDGYADGSPCVAIVVETAHQYCQTDLEDENLTLIQWRHKYEPDKYPPPTPPPQDVTLDEAAVVSPPVLPAVPCESLPVSTCSAVNSTAAQLDNMETEFLKQELKTKAARSADVVPVRQVLAKVDTCLKKPGPPPPKYSTVLNRTTATVNTARSRPPTTNAARTPLSTRPTTTPSSAAPKFTASTSALVTKKSVDPPKPPTRFNLSRPPTAAPSSAGAQRTAVHTVPNNTPHQPLLPAQRFAARSKTMIELPNAKSRAATAAAAQRLRRISREDIASSSSTLKASSELIGSRSSLAGSRTHLQKTSAESPGHSQPAEAEDGWLMVKAKRRSSLHWANRFNQPTGYASLPSLALQQSGDQDAKPAKSAVAVKKENRKVVKSVATSAPANGKAKATVTTSLVNGNQANNNRKAKQPSTKDVSVPNKSNSAPTGATKPSTPAKTLSPKFGMISNEQRQKSDLTGLKLATLRREYMRTANRNKSNASAPSKSPADPASTSLTHLPNLPDESLLRLPTPSARRDLSVSSSCDESEYRDDLESDEDQRKLLEEQESLERQIRELQNTEIDVDTETDETDCETIHEDSTGPHSVDYLTSASVNGTSCTLGSSPRFDADSSVSLETRYQLLLSDMSLGERTETLATLRAFVARHPGRAQELHQKLSSPSRRRSLHETLKLYQAKHARAQAKRDALCREKAHKLQVLLARVEDVKAAKQQLIEEKRLRMEERLQRAAENRTQYLRDKIRKAHDEEEKMKEIAFIKNLEAQNKRLDFMDAWREQEGRLLDLEQERQKRVEEKAAKEAAVEKRRLELELERKRRLEKMNETRREREQRIGAMQEKREKLRQQIARDRARDREERLLALQVQQQHSTEELQRKIIQKQQESARRHEENIEQIRQRALELSIPSRLTEDGQVVGTPRGDGPNGGGPDNDLSSLVSDMSREYTSKSNKKRLKKITQKLQQKSEEYVAEMEPLPAYMRSQSDVPKLLGQVRKGGGQLGLERPLNQLMRCIDKTQVNDYQCFWLADGLGVLARVVQTASEGGGEHEVTRKAQVITVQLYRKLCLQCMQLARHAVLANSYTVLCDALLRSLQTPDETAPGQPVELSTELMIACMAPFPSLKKLHPKVVERLPLVISYVVATGLVDTMARRLLKIRECVENHGSVVLSLLATIGLLTKFGDLCPKGGADPTKFLSTIKSTDLFGTISLLHSTVIPLGECIPPRTVSLAAGAFRLLVTIANLDLAVFQDVLSDEALAFQLLDVATVLLTYCGPKAAEKGEASAVIVDLIATLGFYCANNPTNQSRLTSEQSATIIKALAKLPKDFDMIVYPTLITVITDNANAKQVVGRDFDVTMLEEYKQSKLSQNQKVVSVLHAGAQVKKS